jgi:multiple sugar transport system ATP-binding protein
MTMGDRVCVIKKGELQQVGTPTELFEKPLNLFVAGFIGSPSMNFASTKIEESGGRYRLKLGDQEIELGEKALSERPKLKEYAGKDVIVGIRPQDFEDAEIAKDAPGGSRLKAKMDLVEAIGTETLVHFTINAPVAMTEDMRELAADAGTDAQTLEARSKEGNNEFVATIDPKSKIREGSEGELVIDTTRLHFFDPETSQGIHRNGN